VFEERGRTVRRVLIALPLLALLVFAPAALAGGWATVGLSSTPQGTPPGTPWNVDITVLQHGVTPLDGVQPTLMIRKGNETKVYDAKPTGKPGVYRASVIFPTAGKWNYQVDDGFISGVAHTFKAVDIGGAPAAKTTTGDGGSRTWLAFPGIALIAAAAAILLLRDRRRERPTHQPQAA
jgi:hypothetical protein